MIRYFYRLLFGRVLMAQARERRSDKARLRAKAALLDAYVNAQSDGEARRLMTAIMMIEFG